MLSCNVGDPLNNSSGNPSKVCLLLKIKLYKFLSCNKRQFFVLQTQTSRALYNELNKDFSCRQFSRSKSRAGRGQSSPTWFSCDFGEAYGKCPENWQMISKFRLDKIIMASQWTIWSIKILNHVSQVFSSKTILHVEQKNLHRTCVTKYSM